MQRAAKWTLVRPAGQAVTTRLDGSCLHLCLPKLEDYVVMRVVVRQGFSRDMADMLLGDINNAITELEKLDYPTPYPYGSRKESSGRS